MKLTRVCIFLGLNHIWCCAWLRFLIILRGIRMRYTRPRWSRWLMLPMGAERCLRLIRLCCKERLADILDRLALFVIQIRDQTHSELLDTFRGELLEGELDLLTAELENVRNNLAAFAFERGAG